MSTQFKLSSRGFTFIELLITLVVSGILMSGVYTAFKTQQDSYLAQEQVAETQQNIRAALDIMVREVRMAGFDPSREADASITTATVGRFGFTQDIVGAEPDGIDNDGDGTTDETDGSEPDYSNGDTIGANESVIYGFSSSDDSEPNGIVDGNNVASFGRDTGGGFQPIAENIQAIEFNYLDEDGNTTGTLADIRSVEISILARTFRPDRNYINNISYTTPGGQTWGPYNDKFRRRFQTITVKCRNMGI